DELKGVFVRLDGLAETDLGLALAVGAGFAGAVQKEDYRTGLVALVVVGDEEDVLRLRAVGVLVNAIEEAVVLVLSPCGQGEYSQESDNSQGDAAVHGVASG